MDNRILGTLIVLLVTGAVFISGCTDSTKSQMSPEELKKNATQVTPDDLYNGTVKNGTPVKITGYIIDTQEGVMRICQTGQYNILNYNQDIMVKGNFNATFYENEEVNVWGIFEGPSSYSTAIGGQRTIPLIDQAIVEKTGNRYQV